MVATEKKTTNQTPQSTGVDANNNGAQQGPSNRDNLAAGAVGAGATGMAALTLGKMTGFPIWKTLGKMGKAVPYVGAGIQLAQGARLGIKANNEVGEGNYDEATKTMIGGGIGIGADTGLLGLMALIPGAGWIGLATYAVGQGTSLALTGKSIGENVGSWGASTVTDYMGFSDTNQQSQTAQVQPPQNQNNIPMQQSVQQPSNPLDVNVSVAGLQNAQVAGNQTYSKPTPPPGYYDNLAKEHQGKQGGSSEIILG